jgi:hypothetical protein
VNVFIVFILRCDFFTLVGIQIDWAGICYHVYISRGPARGGGQCCGHPKQQSPRGGQMGSKIF